MVASMRGTVRSVCAKIYSKLPTWHAWVTDAVQHYCEMCERHHTRAPPPISSYAVLRLKLRPPSAESAWQPRDKLRLHFQLLKLAPSGLNPPYFLLPLFFFVEFYFQRLKMHLRCTKWWSHPCEGRCEASVRRSIQSYPPGMPEWLMLFNTIVKYVRGITHVHSPIWPLVPCCALSCAHQVPSPPDSRAIN